MDETTPLFGHADELQCQTTDSPTVDFNPKGDSENPLEWSKAYKVGVISLLGFMAFTTTFTCIGVVPVADRIVLDLQGKESKSASILLVTVWELGEAAGPLLIAPLSEIYGRYPVYNVANIIFIFGVLLAALSPSANTFIFARFLTGLAVAANVLNPAIIGDIHTSESRGSAMSLVMLAPLIGGAIGPAIGGAIAETLGWRNILWMSAILAIICEVCFFVLLRETYKVTILKRRAARLRKETMDESLKCAWDDDGSEGVWWSELRTSITRPVIVFRSSFVLQILSFYGGLMFTLYYVLATTMPGILREVYWFSPAVIGYSFLTFSIGATFAIVACNLCLDDIYTKLGKSHRGVSRPEFRLPFMIAGAIIMPAIVVLYGWAPSAQWPVYVFLLSVGLLGFVILTVSVPLTSYIVDAFGLYSASAMTMILIARCLGGTLLPLAIPPLTDALGLGYGFVFLGAIFLALIPVPILVMRYGSKWRQNSEYTRTD